MNNSEIDARIQPYRSVQNIAKDVMSLLVDYICPGVTEKQIAQKAIELFHHKRVVEFWYYGIAALVLVGRRTTISVSGKDYAPTEETVNSLLKNPSI